MVSGDNSLDDLRRQNRFAHSEESFRAVRPSYAGITQNGEASRQLRNLLNGGVRDAPGVPIKNAADHQAANSPDKP